jgi:hypothetical protein
VRARPEPIVFAATTIVLAANEPDLLDALRMGALRAGVSEERLFLQPASADVPTDVPDDERPGVAVIAVRRDEKDPPFRRTLRIAERLLPMLDPHSIQVAIAIPSVVRLAPKLERRLTEELVHQLAEAGALRPNERPLRNLRLRLGSAGLRAAGVRVFRLKLRA